MSSVRDVDRFFAEELKTIKLNFRAATSTAARELETEVKRQIKTNFNNPSRAFARGIKVYDFDNGSVVRLSPLLSAHAQPSLIESDRNLWILLPDGAKNGFKRISPSFNWTTIKRRYGNRLSFVPVRDGHVLLFRQSNGRVVPIYKLQSSVDRPQRIKFYEAAEEIAKKYV